MHTALGRYEGEREGLDITSVVRALAGWVFCGELGEMATFIVGWACWRG
jgi:hypothetical protein